MVRSVCVFVVWVFVVWVFVVWVFVVWVFVVWVFMPAPRCLLVACSVEGHPSSRRRPSPDRPHGVRSWLRATLAGPLGHVGGGPPRRPSRRHGHPSLGP